MKKKYIFIIILLLFPINIYAASANSEASYGLTLNQCTRLQDNNIFTSGSAYFSKCMKATCSNRNYTLSSYSNNKVTCTNGNNNPYYITYKNGCSLYETTVCNNGDINYCNNVMFYDCSKKSDGSSFTTTTTTKQKPKTTTKAPKTTTSTTTTTTTQVQLGNTNLKSLTLSSGTINFKNDVYEYELSIGDNINNIIVNAIPEDATSQVSVSGNSNLIDGSVISIKVIATDGSMSEYKINVKKIASPVLSNNSNLSKLNIEDYNIKFSPNIKEYSVTISKDIKNLSLEYETEDKDATVEVSGNSNLKNGSRIIIKVTALDGTSSNYVINVFVKKKSNIIKILFIIVLVLAIGAGGYYIYKKIMEKHGGDKYEYE